MTNLSIKNSKNPFDKQYIKRRYYHYSNNNYVKLDSLKKLKLLTMRAKYAAALPDTNNYVVQG